MRTGFTRRRSVLGIATGGVLLGHWLTYVLVDANAHQRTAELASTGHAYLGFANDLGLVAALIALSAVFLGGLTRGEHDGPSLGTLGAHLAAFQVVAFTSMEVLERISAGAPVAEVLHHGVIPVGLAIQVGIAALGALVIRWLLRAAERIESWLGAAPTLPDRAGVAVVIPSRFRAPARRAVSAAAIRGPPLLTSPR